MKHISLRMGLVALMASGFVASFSPAAVAQDAAATYKAQRPDVVLMEYPHGRNRLA